MVPSKPQNPVRIEIIQIRYGCHKREEARNPGICRSDVQEVDYIHTQRPNVA